MFPLIPNWVEGLNWVPSSGFLLLAYCKSLKFSNTFPVDKISAKKVPVPKFTLWIGTVEKMRCRNNSKTRGDDVSLNPRKNNWWWLTAQLTWKMKQEYVFHICFRSHVCPCEIWYKNLWVRYRLSVKAPGSELDPGQQLNSVKQRLETFAVLRGWTGPVPYSKCVCPLWSSQPLGLSPAPLGVMHPSLCLGTGLDRFHTQNMSIYGSPPLSRSFPSLRVVVHGGLRGMVKGALDSSYF